MAKRHFMMAISPRQAEMLQRWMIAEQCQSEQEAVRNILDVAFASMKIDGVEHAHAMRAYYETRAWVIRRVVDSFKDIEQLLESTLGERARARAAGEIPNKPG